MKVAISQPEHFPYPGYFEKMDYADIFVLLDHVAYGGRRSYQNRNRYSDRSGVITWFTVPLQHPVRDMPISTLKTEDNERWRNKITRQIKQELGHDLKHIYNNHLLIDINLMGISYVMDKMGISTPTIRSSELKSRTYKSQLISDICREIGADTYICGPGGKHYLDKKFFNGLSVEYFEPTTNNYMTSLAYV